MEVNICFGFTTSAAGDGAKEMDNFSNETPFFSLFFLHTEKSLSRAISIRKGDVVNMYHTRSISSNIRIY